MRRALSISFAFYLFRCLFFRNVYFAVGVAITPDYDVDESLRDKPPEHLRLVTARRGATLRGLETLQSICLSPLHRLKVSYSSLRHQQVRRITSQTCLRSCSYGLDLFQVAY